MSHSPYSLAMEYGVTDHWVLGLAQGLGIGRYVHGRLYLFEPPDVERLRPEIERRLAERPSRRKRRPSKVRRKSDAPCDSSA